MTPEEAPRRSLCWQWIEVHGVPAFVSQAEYFALRVEYLGLERTAERRRSHPDDPAFEGVQDRMDAAVPIARDRGEDRRWERWLRRRLQDLAQQDRTKFDSRFVRIELRDDVARADAQHVLDAFAGYNGYWFGRASDALESPRGSDDDIRQALREFSGRREDACLSPRYRPWGDRVALGVGRHLWDRRRFLPRRVSRSAVLLLDLDDIDYVSGSLTRLVIRTSRGLAMLMTERIVFPADALVRSD